MGNSIEINLPYQKEKLRIELFGDKIESLQFVNKQNNNVVSEIDNTLIFPAKHFVTTEQKKIAALKNIKTEPHPHQIFARMSYFFFHSFSVHQNLRYILPLFAQFAFNFTFL